MFFLHVPIQLLSYRFQDERKVDGPSIDELVAKESVDVLPYIGWQVAPPEEEVTFNFFIKTYVIKS